MSKKADLESLSRSELSASMLGIGESLRKKGAASIGEEFVELGKELASLKVIHGNWKAVRLIDDKILSKISEINRERDIVNVAPLYYETFSQRIEERTSESLKQREGFWQKLFSKANTTDAYDRILEAGIKVARMEAKISQQERRLQELTPQDIKSKILKDSINRNRELLSYLISAYVEEVTIDDVDTLVKMLKDIQSSQSSRSEVLSNLTATTRMMIDAIRKGVKKNDVLIKLINANFSSDETEDDGFDDVYEAVKPVNSVRT